MERKHIEDLKAGDRVNMDVGACEVLAPATAGRYGVDLRIRTPRGQEYTLNYPPRSLFMVPEPPRG